MLKRSSVVISLAIASLLSVQACSSTPNDINPPTPTPTIEPTPDTVEPSPISQAPQSPTPQPQNRVKVFFPNPEQGNGDLSYVEPVWRRTDRTGVGAFAIAQLIQGPTSQEQALGLEKAITLNGNSNCGEDFQLAINEKVAKLQFCREVVSAGIGDDARAKSSLEATLKQFTTVETVVILDSRGNCFGDMSGENLCLNQLRDKTRKQIKENPQLALTSLGPIHVGMTVEEAARASGVKLVNQSSGGEEFGCLYYQFDPQPKDVFVMVTDGRIARIDVTSKTIKTLSGAGVGSTESEIRRLYPGQIESEVHPYDPQGKYLIFVPQDASQRNYRVIFETDASGTVQRFRSGKLPEVGYIEGCA
jgi:hypothetical protein